MKRVVFAMAMLATLGLGACGKAFDEPKVRMDGLRLGGIGLGGGLVYVKLTVTNPNRFGLEAEGIEYDLDLADKPDSDDWVDFAEGTYAEELKVGGRDSVTVEVPVEFDFKALGGAFRGIMDRGTFNYRVSGKVQVQEPISTVVPFKKRGVVTMSGVR